MPSGRGVLVFVAGIGLWLVARFVGSPTLHIVAVGLVALPFAAGVFARWGRQHLTMTRRLSDARVRPGQPVSVELEMENHAPTSTSFLLLEDRLPAALGRPARLVLAGLPGRRKQRVSYTLLPHVRGTYHLGPLTADLSDPFALTKLRLLFDERDQLLVRPEVERLTGEQESAHGTGPGLSIARHLLRTGEEFFTMRQYQEGDDLRRIHWRSVARTGQLMIRQDESSRRASGMIFLDNRQSALGEIHTPAFEKAVSAAASLSLFLSEVGFSLQFASAQHPPTNVTEEDLLDQLTGLSHYAGRSLSTALMRLRSRSSPDTVLVVVSGPPPPAELASLTRTGTAFGPKIAVLVYPIDPNSLPPERQAQLEGRASVARLSLARAGWDVLVIGPSDRLRDAWRASLNQLPAATASLR